MDVNRHFSKEYIQTANKQLAHKKMLSITEMQIITIMKSHVTLTVMAIYILKKQKTILKY